MAVLTLLINYRAVAIYIPIISPSVARLSVVSLVLIFSGLRTRGDASRPHIISMYVCTLCSRWDAISYFHYLFNHTQRTTPSRVTKT